MRLTLILNPVLNLINTIDDLQDYRKDLAEELLYYLHIKGSILLGLILNLRSVSHQEAVFILSQSLHEEEASGRIKTFGIKIMGII